MKIENRRLEEIIPYEGNPRINDAAVDAVAASIREFGVQQPIVVDSEGIVVVGHTRLKAAYQLGLDTFPVVVAGDLTPQQARAYRIADNRLAEGSEWDTELLDIEIQALLDDGAELDMTGFDEESLNDLLGVDDDTDWEADPDDVPDDVEPVTKPGDIWVLGDHRLGCGDSTDADFVAKVLADNEPHLMVTDPPYGVNYDASWRNKAFRKDGSKSGGRAIGKVANDLNADWDKAWLLFRGDVAYVWCAAGDIVVHNTLINSGLEIRMQIIWNKSRLVIGRGHYHQKHEPCWYAVRKGKTAHWQGDRKQTTVWDIDTPRKSETGHSTQKPVECMKRPIINNSEKGDFVYEPFSGSGTTIIAAEQTGRKCIAIELLPKYCDIAIKRWEEFTGLKAELEHGTETI